MQEQKTIILGVCGGIAAYKSCDIASRLIKMGYKVQVIMTKSAGEFVSPLTFMTLTGQKVITDMFEMPSECDVEHISVAKKADLFLIVPATANVIGKVAGGIADDFLTTTIMATKAPVLFAPAMNSGMWTNAIVQENVDKLKKLGYLFINPAKGRLACGDVGEGKLPDVEDIIEAAQAVVCEKKDLLGKTVLVTAGPTREKIDPVRFITNPSSGKMGYALAKSAYRRGAKVILVTGKTDLKTPYGIDVIKVESAIEMRDKVMEQLKEADIVIKSAAVGDYRAKNCAEHKIKKSKDEMTINLVKNPDILMEIGEKKDGQIIVGFCMETQNLIENAKDKLTRKNLDLIIANQLNEEGAGFEKDTNVVTIIDKNGNCEKLSLMSKDCVADYVLDRVVSL